jgi:hypothetical protein
MREGNVEFACIYWYHAQRRTAMRIRLTAIFLSLLISSGAWADLRIFDVGLQHQQEVFVAIRNVLNRGIVGDFNSNGTAEQLPNGQILVNAQPPVLDQLEQVIKTIRERPVTAAPRVTLRYWAVLGSRAAAAAVGTPPPPALNDVLAELRRLNGDLTFRVVGTAAVTSDSGQDGELSGTTLSVTQRAQVQGDAASAFMRLHLQAGPPSPGGGRATLGEVELRTTLRRGEFVVLGESQVLHGDVLDGPVFYIVHWAEDR